MSLLPIVPPVECLRGAVRGKSEALRFDVGRLMSTADKAVAQTAKGSGGRLPPFSKTERPRRAKCTMARCEQGYICDVCGAEVEAITDSDLYLRYVLGEVAADQLASHPERHIRCNPAMAQFIVDASFPPVRCEGAFAKENLDPAFVADQEAWVTLGWRRLREVVAARLPIQQYPLGS